MTSGTDEAQLVDRIARLLKAYPILRLPVGLILVVIGVVGIGLTKAAGLILRLGRARRNQ